ncbi:MAG: FimV/HubP family polar landmark protein [Halieaceae bacterium]
MGLAVGLGDLTLESYLNEPFKAQVDLLETEELDPGQVKVRLATREDFERAGVAREYFLTNLTFEIEVGEDGVSRLLISSVDPVREPYLDFIIEARWPTGRLLREYAVLLDPPLFAGPGSGITARAAAPTTASRRAEAEAQEQAQKAQQTEEATRAAIKSQREYGANAQEMPAAGAEYLVQRNDTMWRIASRSRPAGASVQQTMLDIQRLNPEAFIRGNINRLKAGYVLRLPDSAQISELPFEQAVAKVADHEQAWQDNLAGIDTRMDASEGRDSYGVAGSDEEDGHLQIAGVDSGGEAIRSGDLSARMEDLDRARRDNDDLEARLGSVEQQMQMQERLIALKDDQIAALQQALGDAGGELDMQAIDQQEGAIEALPDPIADGTETEIVDSQPEPEPEPAPAPAPAPMPEPGIVDMVMDYLIYIVAALLLLVLAVVWMLRDKIGIKLPGRGDQPLPLRGAADEDDEFAGVELVSDDDLVVDEFDEDTEGAGEQEEQISTFSSAPDEDAYAAQFESGDALAEADIYIAYGRFPQAVDLLKAAINVEPLNTDYRMKLMEACVEMVESEEFQQQYADLQVIGDETVLQRARSLLDAVDGGEVWLNDLPPPALSADDLASAQEFAEPISAATDVEMPEFASVDLGMDEEGASEPGFSLDDDLGDDSELALADDGLDADLDAVDLDLDMGLDDVGEPGADDSAAAGPADDLSLDLDDADGGLDLELDADTDAAGMELELEDLASDDEPAPAEAGLDELEIESDLDSFDMDNFESTADNAEDTDLGSIDLPELELESMDSDDADGGTELELAPAEEEQTANFGGLEIEGDESELSSSLDDLSKALGDDEDSFELDTGTDDEPGLMELDSAAADLDVVELDSEADLEALELDVPAGDLSLEGEAPAEGEDSNGEGLVFAADGDEIATKLDLARAYIDMGDHDGARSILDEVQQDGSESQQQEAQLLLDRID